MSSTSENNGIAILTDQDLHIYSIGISTGGAAEIRMAKLNPKRRIIATTIDVKGAQFAQKLIKEEEVEGQVVVKIEDVSKSLAFENDSFDFIYARLVLHYLSHKELIATLKELHHVLKIKGKLFIVVRSSKCYEATSMDASFDPLTRFTTYRSKEGVYRRYFHTEDTLKGYLADFDIKHIKSYEEHLCVDFQRTVPSAHVDSLIEVLVTK